MFQRSLLIFKPYFNILKIYISLQTSINTSIKREEINGINFDIMLVTKENYLATATLLDFALGFA